MAVFDGGLFDSAIFDTGAALAEIAAAAALADADDTIVATGAVADALTGPLYWPSTPIDLDPVLVRAALVDDDDRLLSQATVYGQSRQQRTWLMQFSRR